MFDTNSYFARETTYNNKPHDVDTSKHAKIYRKTL